MDTKVINQLIKRHVCPVCGFKNVLTNDEDIVHDYERCISCGTLCGYDYNLNSSQNHLQTLRNNWVLYGFEM